MKKAFLSSILITAMIVASCKENVKHDASKETKTEATANEGQDEILPNLPNGTPSFSNPQLQAYVTLYEEYIDSYIDAVKNNDASAMKALASKGQELGAIAQSISGKMTSSDSQGLAAYMTKKAKTIQDLTKKTTE